MASPIAECSKPPHIDASGLRHRCVRPGGHDSWCLTAGGRTFNEQPESPFPQCEGIARAFHDLYERLAPDFGYETRPDSAVAWDHVPDRNRRLMIAVVWNLIAADVIDAGGHWDAAYSGTLAPVHALSQQVSGNNGGVS